MEDIYVDLRMQNRWIQEAFNNQDFASVEELLTKIEDLLDELGDVKGKFNDYKNYIEDNYKPITVAEQLDISDKDFI